MANTIQLHLMENKTIVPYINGKTYATEGGYKIIAGEENATQFTIASVPSQYADATFTVEMVNSEKYGIEEADITLSMRFTLPVGMAVAGYGQVLIRAYLDEEVVPWEILKIKVWNTIDKWKDEAVPAISLTEAMKAAAASAEAAATSESNAAASAEAAATSESNAAASAEAAATSESNAAASAAAATSESNAAASAEAAATSESNAAASAAAAALSETNAAKSAAEAETTAQELGSYADRVIVFTETVPDENSDQSYIYAVHEADSNNLFTLYVWSSIENDWISLGTTNLAANTGEIHYVTLYANGWENKSQSVKITDIESANTDENKITIYPVNESAQAYIDCGLDFGVSSDGTDYLICTCDVTPTEDISLIVQLDFLLHISPLDNYYTRTETDNLLENEAETRAAAEETLQSNIDLLETELKGASATSLTVSLNSSTYVITYTLKAIDGTVLSTQTVDLPLESVVVDGSYDAASKSVILTLESGSTVEFSVADLIDGLVSENMFNSAVAGLESSIEDIIDGTTPVANATTAEKVGSSTIGGKAKPVYVSSGTITECTSTVGSSSLPVYMNAGTVTVCSSTLAVSITGNAATATTATKATQDGSGNVITDTYATKTALEAVEAAASSTVTSYSVSITGTTTISVENVTTSSVCMLIADDASAALFAENNIHLSAQAAGSVTVTCGSTPSSTATGTLIVMN